MAQLHLATFGTTYKADVVRLPLEEGMSGYEAPPSISVSAAELKSWLFDAALKLQPLLPGPSGTLSELVELGAAGVFIGAAPGLVVWLMPRDLDAIHRAAARQFNLDADLIVGGIQLADHIAIIGRGKRHRFACCHRCATR